MNFLITFFYWIFELLSWSIVIRVLLSWFGSPYNFFTGIVYQIADPILNLFKNRYFRFGMMDFSPIVAILVLNLISSLLTSLLTKI